ncbi:MAG: DEAD/DEAH box helicase [Muribaculaceae bacterium]|nr:DEAD/DEAH box helicase [Muribaculaceae bacterium]MDE6753654.1 DEAD/DEAH box helicase [Muribaculaceae bacterium]
MREKEFLPAVKERLGIDRLNEMQEKMMASATEASDIILLSPTGSGKTLAFTLPVMKMMKPSTGRVQCVVIAPSRELVVQIAGVLREVGHLFRVIALYGGHSVEDEVNSLKVVPDIIVATPGRLLDHAVRRNVDLLPVRILVLDEFDKSLELGFEEEMSKLLNRMKNVSRTILTSATKADVLPDFLRLDHPLTLDYLDNNVDLRERMNVRKVDSDGKDKLDSLLTLLHNINKGERLEKSIIFVNHRESAERVADFLKKNKVAAVLYHGALDQRERETAVALFNNGTAPVLVATDLAARGLDIEKVASVIHYHQPLTPEAYTHRNGRTARVEEEGDVYVLVGPDEELREYVEVDGVFELDKDLKTDLGSHFMSLYVAAGKKEKVSKGDILGFLIKEGGLTAEDIGKINVFDHYALVAVREDKVAALLNKITGKKLKGEKRRITPLK